MRVHTLRRYPVKSMGGESLGEVEVDPRGFSGDRWFAVADSAGRFASGKSTRRFRRRDEVFGYAAHTDGATGSVVVTDERDAWTVGDPLLDAELSRRMGTTVAVRHEGDVNHQDAGAVSIVGTATLDWCARRFDLTADPRRLRVNVVVETDEPFAEETWLGHTVTLGEVALRVRARIQRCRMIDLDQDGARANGRWLEPLAAERDMLLAVYADVIRPGTIRAGDRVRIGAA